MKWADRGVAAVLFLLGLGVAWKAAELPVGILPREGPGGGFFPFWLSLGVSIAAALVFIRTFVQKAFPEKASGGTFITREGLLGLLRVGLPGLIMILLINLLSIYLAAALFVFYCLYFVGKHKLSITLSVAIGTPIAVYVIFERFLILPLPKGLLESLFYLD
ncbi:MAG: tripartite tricarboxylate transporter TctB family protein [bacterium]|nr:tripartite tricarboxylate transporter TctB family protein [bacterium]